MAQGDFNMLEKNKISILVAEDDPNILTGLTDLFTSEGYIVHAAGDGDEALNIFSSNQCDLVVLDIMMPKTSGYDVCREIRKTNQLVPVLMLTAKGEEMDKIVGFSMGADDYLTKPFGVSELLARVKALLRRSKLREQPDNDFHDVPDKFKFGPIEVDARKQKAMAGNKTIELSGREVALLKAFYAHPDEVLSRDKLLNMVWGINYYGTTRTLDQHIAKLRKKIEPVPARPTLITTVHGTGYRFEKK